MFATVFVETTIPSYYVARPSRNLLKMARQALTREWWDVHRAKYELFTTRVVIDEAAAGEYKMAQARLKLLAETRLLTFGEDAEDLAHELVEKDIVPGVAARDAMHIAAAGVHRMDFLLTWNCRHIANAHIQKRLRACFSQWGIDLPVICTPEELLSDENDYSRYRM